MTDWIARAAGLADELTALGKLRSPSWQAAVRAVPRHEFVPVHHVFDRGSGGWVARRTALAQAYSNTVLFVLPDGLSSSSVPGLTTRMLEALDVRDGHRVLEIGTGTGYTAALLCHRLGAEQVFSVELDPGLVDVARDRLAALGYRPTLVAADGRHGLADGAPYDRVLATCSVPAVPPAWLTQTRDGGRLLVDVTPGPIAGNIVLLHRDGDRAEGRFDPVYGSVMAMRSDPNGSGSNGSGSNSPGQANTHPQAANTHPQAANTRGGVRERVTGLDLSRPWECTPFWFFAHFLLPAGTTGGARGTATVLHAPDGSWCEVGPDRRVLEAGPRDLWRTVETRHATWQALGEPGWERFGLTATPQRQWVWLDHPDAQHTREVTP